MNTADVTIDNHYKHQRLATIYDDGNGWGNDREFYLSLAGDKPQHILDVGCGTGIICHAYAALGHHVTGLDPAESMLIVAKANPLGDKITWVNASVQEFNSEQKFDLIIMTGHALQCLLTTQELQSCLQTMAQHIARDGQIVFETRNPNIDWKSKWHNTGFNDGSGENKAQVNREVTGYTNNSMSFTTKYHFSDETLQSDSELRFWAPTEVSRAAGNAGLKVKTIFGDWDRSPFDPHTSEEIIFSLQAESR